MKLKTAFISIVVSVSLISSCTNPNGDQERLFAKQWLDNLICEFPCWQNITPLVTSFDDAKVALQQDKDLNVDFISEEEVSFQSDNVSGSIEKTPDQKVKSIVLLLKGLILSDVIEIIGLPEELVIAKDLNAERCLVSIRFPEKGTFLDLYVENNADNAGCEVDLKPESKVFRILLVEKNPPLNSSLSYIKWKGYGIYP